MRRRKRYKAVSKKLCNKAYFFAGLDLMKVETFKANQRGYLMCNSWGPWEWISSLK